MEDSTTSMEASTSGKIPWKLPSTSTKKTIVQEVALARCPQPSPVVGAKGTAVQEGS